MSLELAAMRWLWIDKKCLVVLEERTPSYQMGQPDVLGITAGRYMVEIEIKRSVSDFRADAKKDHRINRSRFLKNQPRQFYYLMESRLADKLVGEIPEWAGLMKTDERFYVEIVKQAPVNKESLPLSLKQCVRLSRMMTSHMMGYAQSNQTLKSVYRNGTDYDFTIWVDAEKGTYQI